MIANNVIAANDHSNTTPQMRRELVLAGQEGALDTWWIPGEVIASCLALREDEEPEVFKRAIRLLQRIAEWKANKERPDLRGADLSGAVLRDADLSDRERAVLRDADLSGADLSGAVLRDADLRGADLSDAVLRDAVLSGSRPERCRPERCRLRGADLSGAVLRGADLSGAVLSDAVLRDADLSGADLSGAVLSGAVLSDAVERCRPERCRRCPLRWHAHRLEDREGLVGARGVTTTIPTRSQGQRLDALRIATDIRIAKATLKADIRSGKIGPVHALKRQTPHFDEGGGVPQSRPGHRQGQGSKALCPYGNLTL